MMLMLRFMTQTLLISINSRLLKPQVYAFNQLVAQVTSKESLHIWEPDLDCNA